MFMRRVVYSVLKGAQVLTTKKTINDFLKSVNMFFVVTLVSKKTGRKILVLQDFFDEKHSIIVGTRPDEEFWKYVDEKGAHCARIESGVLSVCLSAGITVVDKVED